MMYDLLGNFCGLLNLKKHALESSGMDHCTHFSVVICFTVKGLVVVRRGFRELPGKSLLQLLCVCALLLHVRRIFPQ